MSKIISTIKKSNVLKSVIYSPVLSPFRKVAYKKQTSEAVKAYITNYQAINVVADSKLLIKIEDSTQFEFEIPAVDHEITINDLKLNELLLSSAIIYTTCPLPTYFIKKANQKVIYIIDNLNVLNNMYDPKDISLISKYQTTFMQCSEIQIMLDDQDHITEFLKKYSIHVLNAIKVKVVDQKLQVVTELELAPLPKQVVIFPGPLYNNGITTSFFNQIANLKQNGYADQITILLFKTAGYKQYIENFEKIANSGFNFLFFDTPLNIIDSEFEAYTKLFLNAKLSPADLEQLSLIGKRESNRLLANINASKIVHFTGYNSAEQILISNSALYKIIFVHNDLEQEIALKSILNKQLLMDTYDKVDKIAIVNENVGDKLKQNFFQQNHLEKIEYVKNTIDFENLKTKSAEPIPNECSDVADVLENAEIVKFISVARYSIEKNHRRLLKAYEIFQTTNPQIKSALILIGGSGPEKANIEKLIEKSPFQKQIYMYENINPLPVLKQCQALICSSDHEGLPMVFFEAIYCNVPVISVAIDGPKQFLESGYGYTCQKTSDDLAKTMSDLINGNLSADLKSLTDFNNQACSEVEKLYFKDLDEIDKNSIN